ncbi:MAG: flagellar biosynthesis protein FlhB [Rhizomicrobium sp.]|jgi:flagellar biosynthetic protein FlhB
MADDRDDSQRTEEPTQRRLSQAHEQGDVVKSTEVTSFVLLMGVAIAFSMFARSAATGFIGDFRIFLEQPDQLAVDPGGAMLLLRHCLTSLALLLAPIFGVLMLMGVAGHVLQHRPVFSASRLAPDLSKLSLLSGLKRIFGLEGVTNLGKGLIKMAIVAVAVWTTVWPLRLTLQNALTQSPAAIAAQLSHIVVHMLTSALAVLAVIAVGDYMLQRYRFLQRNRMSKQEIKDEYKQAEGDPLIKGKIRQIRVERARKRMMAEVPKATVVIMNPTHYAVALKYESGKMAAPVCVAKGVDSLALKIREVAEENDVPVVENAPLARALYATVELDEAVPPEHFKAVAQVIGYVMRLTGQIRH